MAQQVPQFIGIPPQQQQQQQQQAAAGGQAAAADTKLNGVPPTVFDGDRSMSEQFINEFAMYRALNHDHRIMANPYLQTVLALQYIKGPNVRDWANDQLRHLDAQIQPPNPVPTTDNALWDDFVNAFTITYTDTTAQQTAYHQLQGLKMRGHDLDTYVARFTHLCTKVQVDKDTMAIHSQFARGLHPEL